MSLVTADGGTAADGRPRLLVLDLGSSSVRAALYDLAGAPLPGTEVQLGYAITTSHDGEASVDADALVALTAQAIDACLAAPAAAAADIVAVVCSTQWHSLLGLDGAGRPTTPLFTWADRRSATAAAELRRSLDAQAVHRRTGCVLHSSYWPAKLAWLRASAPEAFARTCTFVSVGEYLERVIGGATGAAVGRSMASATGLYDLYRGDWDDELLAALGLARDQLPPISDAPRRSLQPAWAARWPQLAGAVRLPAVGDGACSNVGCGATTPDRLALMVGTSGAMRVLHELRPGDAVNVPEGLWCYEVPAPAGRRRLVSGGALSDGGNLVAWLRRTLALPPAEALEAELATLPPLAHGLTFLPLLGGERGPGWNDEARGAVHGLSFATRPAEIVQAAMEGVALRLRLVAERIRVALPGERQVIATGGALHASPAWTQIIADVLGREVVLSGAREASSRGAALLGAEALGLGPEVGSLPAPPGRRFVPRPGHEEAYGRALLRQLALQAVDPAREGGDAGGGEADQKS